VVLFVLDLYVVEPVVSKLHVTSLNLLLDVPGHKMADLKRYLEEMVPSEGGFPSSDHHPEVLFESGWTNLQAIIQAPCDVSG